MSGSTVFLEELPPHRDGKGNCPPIRRSSETGPRGSAQFKPGSENQGDADALQSNQDCKGVDVKWKKLIQETPSFTYWVTFLIMLFNAIVSYADPLPDQ